MYEDWTPDVRRLDPRCTRTGPLMRETLRPSLPCEDFLGGLRKDFMGFGTSWDSGLRGIRDFMGFRTLWDSELHGIQDFVGFRTSWGSGLHGI